jgi:hypothetical protein
MNTNRGKYLATGVIPMMVALFGQGVATQPRSGYVLIQVINKQRLAILTSFRKSTGMSVIIREMAKVATVARRMKLAIFWPAVAGTMEDG